MEQEGRAGRVRGGKSIVMSNTREQEELDALWGSAAPRRVAPPPHPATSSSNGDSYFGGNSDADSDDSAEVRRKAAAARLESLKAVAREPTPPPAALLPSADAAFSEVDGPPAFLDPEATRPLAAAVHLGMDRSTAGGAGASNAGPNKRGDAAGAWDISRMAPALPAVEGGPGEPGVISGAAVRYRGEERVAPTAAQIAMLGGDGGDEPGGGESAPGTARPKPGPGGKRTATKAMGVEEFMEKGVGGGASLPRKKQDRKDREKEKRDKGQSTHASWKTEAEMVMRQQYD